MRNAPDCGHLLLDVLGRHALGATLLEDDLYDPLQDLGADSCWATRSCSVLAAPLWVAKAFETIPRTARSDRR